MVSDVKGRTKMYENRVLWTCEGGGGSDGRLEQTAQ